MPFSCCSASFCKNNRYNVSRRGLDITFHTFPPRHYPVTNQWVQFCKREENWIPHKHSVLCSAHFREDDFQMANSPVIKQGKRIRHLISMRSLPSSIVRRLLCRNEKSLIKCENNFWRSFTRKTMKMLTKQREMITRTARQRQTKRKRRVLWINVERAYFLQRYPNVCAFCLRIIHDPNVFVPVTHYHDALECTIEQKFDEITGDPMNQEDRSDVQHLLPDKVCIECVTMVVKFHQYQRQLECIKKFSTGIAHLLYGNEQPLENLYRDQGPYLVNILKRLDAAQGTRINQSLEQLLEEVTSYGNIKQSSTMSVQHATEDMSLVLCSNTESVLTDSDKLILRDTDEVMIDKEKNKSQQLYTCPYMDICSDWFSTHSAFQHHIRDDHKTFSCHVCGFKIAFYDLFKKHMESHSIARALLLSHNRQSASLDKDDENDPDVYASVQELNSHRPFASSTKIATPRDILRKSNESKPASQRVKSDEWDEDAADALYSTASTNNTSSKRIELLKIEFVREMQ
uniref:THAP-type domain-containing protein n=1 Tax=Anopheles funestus TaxID=62324 RepID=A0A4Y0BPB8_ANOFN